MATLTSRKVSDTYKDLLQVSNSNSGITGSLTNVEDGEGTASVLQLSSSAVNITGAGTLQYAGTAITATAAEINVLDGFTGDVNDFNYLKDLRATGVTATEFDYLDGVTSNIQTQLDSATGFRPVTAGGNTLGASETLAFTEGSNITITESAGAVTIAATNTQLSTEQVQDIAGPLVATGGTKTRISVTYDDDNGNMDFVVDNDLSNYDNSSSGFLTAHP